MTNEKCKTLALPLRGGAGASVTNSFCHFPFEICHF
jgi:hypothetical protein